MIGGNDHGNVTKTTQSFPTDGIHSKLRMNTLGRGSVENIFLK
jgi:hypothetical protein